MPDIAKNQECICLDNLNLYKTPECESLVTQAATHRHLRILGPQADDAAIWVQLCEDDYPGWLAICDLEKLAPASQAYQPLQLSEAEIKAKLPAIIAFTHSAMNIPNEYLWGGTVGPNYDCSGLMQTAFCSAGIWLPRDAYQQEAFTKPIDMAELQPGDLVFFGPVEKATHVGLYIGENRYIHSSGIKQGRNGIGIDILSEQGDQVSRAYYAQLRGAGRVVNSYLPQN